MTEHSKLTLCYNQPANAWHQALPVGNGHLGAMVFGDSMHDRIQVTEESIWAGPPVPEMPETAKARIEKARELVLKGEYVQAEELADELILADRIAPRSQQPLCDVIVDFFYGWKVEIADYYRELDLSAAVARARWKANGAGFESETFCSVAENACITRYRSDASGGLSCSIKLQRECGAVTRCLEDGTLLIEGQASHKGRHVGVKFAGILHVEAKGGVLLPDTDTVHIENADEVILTLTAETDYNFKGPATPLTHDRVSTARQRAKAVAAKDYGAILSTHLADHQRLFNRVDLQLGASANDERPIDERVQAIRDDGTDTALEALQFQYGRYLLMTSSRPGSMPANLQGVWNESMAAAWNCDYHININFQMNYWHAESTNLSECHEPFFDLVEGL